MNEAAPLPSWAIPACRLWQHDTAHGTSFVGTWGGAKVVIYRNPDKRDADDADYVLCFARPRPTISTEPLKESAACPA